jgi:putative endopeptidase
LDVIQKAVLAKTEHDKPDLAQALGTLALEYGISTFLNIGVSPDNSNTDHSILQVSQGGLGLPDRDYYFDEDKQDKRDAYKKAVALMLTLLEDPTATEATEQMLVAAKSVYDLEFQLAEKHMTKIQNRDPHDTYNKMSIDDFVRSTGDGIFDFRTYLTAATTKSIADLGDINIRNVEALKRVAEVISSVDPTTLGHYLKWHTVKSVAPYMSKAFVNAHFAFYETEMQGTKEIKPRWKRAMAFTESALGEALGKIYCKKYFDETSKERALKVVEQVRKALEERLKEVEWMKAESTRAEALKKMSKFGVKIGYPDKWTDYSTLQVNDKTFLEMVFAARKFDSLQDVKEMNAPTDRAKWFMTPQTINAYVNFIIWGLESYFRSDVSAHIFLSYCSHCSIVLLRFVPSISYRCL